MTCLLCLITTLILLITPMKPEMEITQSELKKHNTVIAAASVKVNGAKLWNNQDVSLKIHTKRKTFRSHFKSETIKLYN